MGGYDLRDEEPSSNENRQSVAAEFADLEQFSDLKFLQLDA